MSLEWCISAWHFVPGHTRAIPQGHPGTKSQLGNVPGKRRVLGVRVEDAPAGVEDA